jgi:hypothetical protein
LHETGDAEKRARQPLAGDRTFSESNRRLFFNPDNPPPKSGEAVMDEPSPRFQIM